jgi:MFS family permease
MIFHLPNLLKTKEMRVIIAITMVTMMGGSVISPALPVIQSAFNIPTKSIGLLMTAFSMPGIIAIPIVGALTDRYGRKRVIVPLLLLYGLAGGLCFFAPNFEILITLRFFSGIGASSLATLTLILCGDFFIDDKRSQALGYRTAFGQLANGILPIIGGVVALVSWQFPFLLYLLALPVAFIAMVTLSDKPPTEKFKMTKYLSNLKVVLASFRIRCLLTIAPTLMIFNTGIVYTYLPIYLSQEFKISPALIGLIIAARVITSTFVSFLIGKITKIIKEEFLVIISFLILAIAAMMVPTIKSLEYIFMPVLLMGLGIGIGLPAFQKLLIDEASTQLRATVMSANGVTNRLGQASGPILGGFLYEFGDFETVFFGSSAFLILMILFLSLNLFTNKVRNI